MSARHLGLAGLGGADPAVPWELGCVITGPGDLCPNKSPIMVPRQTCHDADPALPSCTVADRSFRSASSLSRRSSMRAAWPPGQPCRTRSPAGWGCRKPMPSGDTHESRPRRGHATGPGTAPGRGRRRAVGAAERPALGFGAAGGCQRSGSDLPVEPLLICVVSTAISGCRLLVDVVVADGEPGWQRFAVGVWADGE
jgi:hypothetical protein